jgi:serine/threonine-protein kinase
VSEGSRYDTIIKLAAGGMATVWVGTVRGALGFRQLVAIKKPHPHLLDDPSFRSELVAEARLASMIHHANVVDVRDVEIEGTSISLVMDYIEGASLGEVLVAASRRGERVAPRVCVRIALDALAGLHAAHELVDERGRPVGLVHRDVSPQNVIVGTDGNARVADFGVAKFARKNMQSTSEGSLKGKLAYMAPEYVKGQTIDRRFDVFAMGVVLWEAVCGKRCFRGENEAETMSRVLTHEPEAVSKTAPAAAALDPVISCALAKSRDERFQNAAAMAAALEAAAGAAGLLGSHSEVAAALKELMGDAIEERRALVRSKLANEPSVASLMGVPSLEAAPATQVDVPATVTTAGPTPRMPGAPTKAPSTPEMPGAPKRPTTQPSPVADPNVRPTPQGVVVAPPTEPEATQTGAIVPATIASPGAMSAIPSTMPMTEPSGPNAAPTASTLRSDVELAFHEASGRSFTGTVEPEPIVAKRSGGWVLPVVVGVATAAIGAGVVLYVANRGGPANGGATSATPSASAIASTIATASATTAPPTASAAASAAAPAPSASAIGRPAVRHTGPTTTATGTIKPPPPNPYADPK